MFEDKNAHRQPEAERLIFRETDQTEIWAVIGVMLLRGVFKWSKHFQSYNAIASLQASVTSHAF